jgi:outer membrane protein TolC
MSDRYKRFGPVLVSGLLLLAASVAAAEEHVLVLTPREAIDRALDSHPSLLGQRERLEENRHRIAEAFSAAWPQVDGHVSAVRNRDPGFLNTPGFDGLENLPTPPPDGLSLDFLLPVPVTTYDYRISVEQLLYSFGKVGKGIEAAKTAREQARFEVRDVEIQVARGAVLACYALARAEARMEVLAAERSSLERQRRQAEDFLEIGTGTRLQVLQAQAALSALKPRELGAMGEIQNARAALNQAIGRSPLAPVAVDAGLLDRAVLPDIPSVEDLVTASGLRPDLQALGENRKVLGLLREIEGTNRLPEFKLSGSYGYRAIETENLFNYDYASWNVGLYLDWHLFDGRRTRARTRQLESQRKQNEWNARNLQSQAASNLVIAVESYKQARDTVEAAEEAIDQAEEAHRVAEEARRWGAATMLEVLEAERILAEVRFQRLDAIHAALGSLAEIHFLVGTLPLEPLTAAGELE